MGGTGSARSAGRHARATFLGRHRASLLGVAVSALLGLSVLLSTSSSAFIFVVPAPSLPDTVVGQTAPAALGISNNSTPPESTTNPVVTISMIDLYPACSNGNQDCIAGTAEAGVYAFSATGTGQSTGAPNPTCEGTWTIVPDTGNVSTTTRYRFVPPAGEGSLMLATGESCIVNFTSLTRRVPSIDAAPVTPGVQTNHVASSTADGPTIAPLRSSGTDQSTVNQAIPGLTTTVNSASVPFSGSSFDSATLSPAPPPSSASGVAPTGTITFNLYGPANLTCSAAGAVVFTSTVAVNHVGAPAYTSTSTPPLTTPGTYHWVAIYSGDANYSAVGPTACNDAAETFTVGKAVPTLTTTAAGTTFGQPLSDTASLSGGSNPTGTITFTAYGPNNATCTGPAFFTSTVPVNGNGNYNSGPSPNVSQAGTYRWIASYSGDANNSSITGACGDPSESTTVANVNQPTIVTAATPTATLGQPVSDTATLSGGVNPTGTVTFTLFGPANPTCTGAPIFTSTVPVAGNGNYNSAPFTPTAVGTYNWGAAYSGDANNLSATSPCGSPSESSVVTAVPTVTVDKTANPTSRPEPGGDFTYTVVVTNTGGDNLTINTLNDNIYGNLPTRPGSTCNTAIGTVLAANGGSYTCTFTGPFFGNAGASQTDIVTVTAQSPAGTVVTDTDDATVSLTAVAPTVSVDKTASPLSLPAPGGTFTFTVVVTNTSTGEAVTVTSLTDNIYGDLATGPARPAAPSPARSSPPAPARRRARSPVSSTVRRAPPRPTS